MSEPSGPRGVERAPLRQKKRIRRTRTAALSILAVLVVAAAAWIGVRGVIAKNDLETAQSMVGQLKSQISNLDFEAATRSFDTISAHTRNARELSSDGLWRATEFVPWLGKNFTAVREIAKVTDDVMSGVGGELIDVVKTISPESLTPEDGGIDLAPFEKAAPVIVGANARMQVALANAQAIDTDGTISQLVAAKTKIVTLLGALAPTLETLAAVLPVLPTALGAESPRTYVIMFQNPAEARALGGTALSFAVVKMDNGRIELEEAIPAGFGNFDRYSTSVIPTPNGAEAVYANGAFGTFIANATIRPSFTTAAETTQEMWKRQFGYSVDGVLSIDPTALSYVLRATGPIQLSSGDQLTSKNLVSLLLNKVYQRYNSGDPVQDNLAQNVVYTAAVEATFNRLINGPMDPKVLISAIAKGWDEHRILFWSGHGDEQTAFAHLGRNGELPLSDATTDRVGVYFQDYVGSKLNYYLTTAVTLGQASCVAGGQNYRVGVNLTSTVPADPVKALSPSILGEWQRSGTKPGVQRMIVYLYAPPRSQIAGAIIDGKPVVLESLHDTDHPVGKVVVSVQPGATVKLSYDLIAKGSESKALEALVTPMVNPTTISTSRLDCTTIQQDQ